MTAPLDANLIIDALRAHVDFLLDRDPNSQVAFLARLLDFLDHEARLSGILVDLDAELQAAEDDLDAEFESVHRDIAELWERHASDLQAIAGDSMEEPNFGLMRREAFESALSGRKAVGFQYYGDHPAEQQHGLLCTIEHWLSHAEPADGITPALGEAQAKCNRLKLRHDTLLARLRRMEATSPGIALRQLRWLSQIAAPDLTGESSSYPGEAWVQAEQHGAFLGRGESVHFDHEVKELPGRVRLLAHELTHHLLSGMSRASLLKRYASRCEQFDAEELRELCLEDTGNAETKLTFHAAKYFYDQGLNPLVDIPHAGRLRPDVFDPKAGPALYIECKQYDMDAAKAIEGIPQVWNTWGRLHKQFPTTEAFLLVFRRGGQTIEPPYLSVQYEGRRLHFVLVDIGESKDSGSKTKRNPVALTRAMLLPEGVE
jgi:hypothetical protein